MIDKRIFRITKYICFYFQRMSANNSQTGQCPSESLILNREHQSDIDQLLSMEIVTTTTNQSSSSSTSIQLNTTDMVVNVQQHNNVTPRQNARSEEQHQQQAFQQIQQQQNRQEQQRRLQQRQQRLQQELRRIQQQQQSLGQETQREGRRRRRERQQQRFQQWLESQNITYEQWVERRNQERAQRIQHHYDREEERYRERREEWEHEQYLLRRSPGFDESIDGIFQERELDQYQIERMTPQERQAICEQEQLNELEGNLASRPYGIPIDDFERYATFKAEQLHNDELEQTMNIDIFEFCKKPSDETLKQGRNRDNGMLN